MSFCVGFGIARKLPVSVTVRDDSRRSDVERVRLGILSGGGCWILPNVIPFNVKAKSRIRIDPGVADIVHALSALGGAAHRQSVADWIINRRSGYSSESAAEQRDVIYEIFAGYVIATAKSRQPPLLWTPLGRGSYRWALTEQAKILFGIDEGSCELRRTRSR